MRIGSSTLLVVAAALVLGCDAPLGLPTDAPAFRAAQGDRSEWTLVAELSIPESGPLPAGFIACMNTGLGEEAVAWGDYEIYFKAVVTPSGNSIMQGWLTGEEWFLGLESGDLWKGSFDAKYREFTRAKDGHLLLQEPVVEVLANPQTGERIRLIQMFRLELDDLGNVVNKNFRYGSFQAPCHMMK